MLKKLVWSTLFIALIGGGYYLYNENSEKLHSLISDYIDYKSFPTLEIRYSAQGIMETHKDELVKDDFHKYLKPSLHFYPYVLMEVKYSKKDNTTAEGIVLWDLECGEFITSTSTWEKTHGFEDCITSNADQHDFRIINALASKGGALNRKELANLIRVDTDVLDRWLESCRRKKIIVQTGNGYRLHLQKPKIALMPETKIFHQLVTQTVKNASQRPKRYTRRQVERIATLAFGPDFTIRKATEIYLPVYKIDVQNPDGSVLITYWNALTGQQISNLHTIL